MANDYNILKVFRQGQEVHFVLSQNSAYVVGMPDASLYTPDCDFVGIAKHYGFDGTGWSDERIVNLPDVQKDLDTEFQDGGVCLHGNWITSLDVKAHRKGIVQLNPLGVIGVTKTKDHQLVIGLRGGELTPEGREIYGRGYLGAFPGGSASWKESYEHDVAIDTIVREAREEMGDVGVRVEGVVGYVTNTGVIPSSNLVMRLGTDATLSQLQDINERSIRTMNNLLEDYFGHGRSGDISKILMDAGLAPDAWENEVLFGIPKNPRKILFTIKALKDSFTGSTSGALDAYVQHRWPDFEHPEF